jgi:hypothetical protein
MPRSAIDMGAVDFKLNTIRIAKALARLTRHPGSVTAKSARF